MTMVVMNKEISDNTTKFNRWAIQSIIAGVDKMRFAFVQRAEHTSNKSHKVVGFESLVPDSFANTINLNL